MGGIVKVASSIVEVVKKEEEEGKKAPDQGLKENRRNASSEGSKI